MLNVTVIIIIKTVSAQLDSQEIHLLNVFEVSFDT